MNPENDKADLHRKPNEPTATHANGSPHTKTRDFARRAKVMFSKLPSSLDARMKDNPYATFGIALALGAGAGILLGSRILRTVLASAASYALIELGRTYLRETMVSPS
jgi:hypothetical protein